MSGHQPFNRLRESMAPQRRSANAEATRAMLDDLARRELGRAREGSREELAHALGVEEAAVATIEQRVDLYVSSLRRRIEALGGTLEITARFSGASVTITNFGEPLAPAE